MALSAVARHARTPAGALAVALAWFGVVFGLVVGAGELLDLAERTNGSTAFDSSVTHWMVAHRVHWATVLAKGFALLGSQKVLAPVVIVVAAALLWRRRPTLAGFLVVAWGGGLLLYSFAKVVVGRQRPPMRIWLMHVSGTSFPSGHATQSVSTYVGLVFVVAVVASRGRWAASAVAVVLALGVGWSRVYLGVHWTTDVLAGWLGAMAWVTAVVWLGRSVGLRRD